MKITQIILLTLGLFHQSMSQDIESLERKLSSGGLTTIDSIETLNLISRGLTFVNHSRALVYATKALELSTKTNYSIGTAYAYRNLSSIYSYNDNYFISMEYIQRALDIFELINDSIGIANCYISLGHTYRRLQNSKEEIEYHKMSYEIFKRLNDKERVGVTSHNLGESYYNAGDLKRSRELTLYAININDSLNNKSVLSSCYKVMGMIELSEKNLALAENYFKRVLDLTIQLGENSQKIAMTESMIQLATVYKLMGDLDKQSQFLLAASEFSNKNNLPNYLQRVYQELILYSSTKNDLLAVKKYVNSYRVISDSLNQRQLRDRYSLTKSIVQVHQLSKSKIELEKTNLLQSQKIKNRNTILLVIVISAIVLLWLLLKFTRLNKRLKVQNLFIESQKNELETINEDLISVNKELDTFSYSVAHDLRAPLRAVNGYAQMLNEDYGTKIDEEGKRIIESIRYYAMSMGTLIDELLTFSRLGRKEVQKKEIDMNELTKSVLTELNKSITHIAKIKTGKLHKIKADDALLKQVMFNLVSNAVKYSSKKKNPLVEIFSEEKKDEVIFSIKDNGVGFDMKYYDKLFGVFQRLHKQNEFEGVGVGLAIVQRIIAKHGGKVWAEGQIDKGATFNFSLPLG